MNSEPMSENDIELSIGNIFVTYEAPYLRYLASLRPDACPRSDVEICLRDRVDEIKQSIATSNYMPTDHDTYIEILDIRHDQKLKVVASLDLRSISNGTQNQARDRMRAVNNFLPNLHRVTADTETRLILLRTQENLDCDLARYNGKDQAPVELLFAHVLGIELGLPQSSVRRLCHFQALRTTNSLQDQGVGMESNLAAFGTLHADTGGCLVHFVGKRRIDARSVDIVVIRANSTWLSRRRASSYQRLQGDEHWQYRFSPEEAPAWCRLGDVLSRPFEEARHDGLQGDGLQIFKATIRHIWKQHPMVADGNQQLVWLQAILWLESIAAEADVEQLWKQSKEVQSSARRPELEIELWRELRRLDAALTSTLEQASSLQKAILSLTSEDVQRFADRLDRLQRHLSQIISEVNDSADAGIKLKGLELTQTSIDENKAAIALTNIAFIFIPVNLASSIFGMNVQEINSTGNGIWAFAITAVTMLLLSGLAWSFWKVRSQWLEYKPVAIATRRTLHNWRSNGVAFLCSPWDQRQNARQKELEKRHEEEWRRHKITAAHTTV